MAQKSAHCVLLATPVSTAKSNFVLPVVMPPMKANLNAMRVLKDTTASKAQLCPSRVQKAVITLTRAPQISATVKHVRRTTTASLPQAFLTRALIVQRLSKVQ
jgi:hypothetical protein